ncbi:hypothetical protein GDO81_013701 [Engystomops pustulosus]|uniref:ATP synthase F0 subunit 8 n=1 Tax=Engystomops pustulosus TaxID=76066 RepID=A0AAV7B4Y8_ENGPU|nr:hypothetical protein GDO81_013701 [Engystomops pustulosus]
MITFPLLIFICFAQSLLPIMFSCFFFSKIFVNLSRREKKND